MPNPGKRLDSTIHDSIYDRTVGLQYCDSAGTVPHPVYLFYFTSNILNRVDPFPRRG